MKENKNEKKQKTQMPEQKCCSSTGNLKNSSARERQSKDGVGKLIQEDSTDMDKNTNHGNTSNH